MLLLIDQLKKKQNKKEKRGGDELGAGDSERKNGNSRQRHK